MADGCSGIPGSEKSKNLKWTGLGSRIEKMTKADFFLSKSKYLSGLQCPKLLWVHYSAKENIPPTDTQTQAIFDQGHKVTELAHALFPGGVALEGAPEDFEGLIEKTKSLLLLKKPLYEAAFKFKRSFARADILKPNKDGSWDLYEVKSSTSVKDTYYADCAFQKYCYEGAGLKIQKVYVVYINNEYVKDGPIDAEALFKVDDITEAAQDLVGDVEGQMDRLVDIVKEKACPDIKIGVHC